MLTDGNVVISGSEFLAVLGLMLLVLFALATLCAVAGALLTRRIKR